MTDNTILQIVGIITAAVTTLGLAYIRARIVSLEAEIVSLKKMLMDIQVLVGGKSSDPVLLLQAALAQLQSARGSGQSVYSSEAQSTLVFPPGYEGLHNDVGVVG